MTLERTKMKSLKIIGLTLILVIAGAIFFTYQFGCYMTSVGHC